MAFYKTSSLDSHGAPILTRVTLTNSLAIVELDSVKISSGFVDLGTAGAAVFGHATNFAKNDGSPITTTGAAGASEGSYAGTFTAASDNQTVAQVKAIIDVSKQTLYSAEVSQAIGTTTGSNLVNYNMDLSDENTLDETSATTSTAQYHNFMGTDPYNSARAVVNIKESSVFN